MNSSAQKKGSQGLPQLKRADKTLMTEQVVSTITDHIVHGKLKPGTELPPEIEMAAQIGVSKFVMREALRVLQVLGLVEITQGKRTRVAENSLDPIISLMALTFRRSDIPFTKLVEARRCLEGQIARLAAERAEAGHIAAMEETQEILSRSSTDLEASVDADIRFHELLIEASGNPAFKVMLQPLALLLRDSRREQLKVGGIERVIEYHGLILNAVKDHNPGKAEAAMNIHLEKAAEDVKAVESRKKK